MKTKIGSTKKILAASVALLASLGVAAGSTFAWFTTSSQVDITGYSTQIVSGSDTLTMAVADYATANTDINATWIAGKQFKTALTISDFSEVVSNYASARLGALTSTNGTSFAREDGTAITESATNSLANISSEQGGYAAFKLVLRNRAGANANIYLGAASAVTATSAATSIPYSANQFPYISSKLTAYGTPITNSFSTHGAYASRISLTTGTTTKNWAPHELNIDGTNGSSGTANPTAPNDGYWLDNLAYDYKAQILGNTPSSDASVRAQATLANPVAATATTAAKNADSLIASSAFATIGTDTTWSYAIITVRIWIEGTDGDCFDVVLQDAFTTKLELFVAA